MFAVCPKYNCPHIKDTHYDNFDQVLSEIKNDFNQKCLTCEDSQENWICLECNNFYCSRYIEKHMLEHYQNEKHEIGFSLTDGSFWCFECDDYITNPTLDQKRFKFSQKKFPEQDELDVIQEDMENLKIDEKSLTYKEFIDKLKNKQYKKITVLTGAGISVSAGIPDFRSPQTGLYSKLQKYNLPRAECVFDLEFFKSNPQPFYQVAEEFLLCYAKPVAFHHFLTILEQNDQLHYNFTQNIDGLELDAGLSKLKLIEAHGHMRSAHCTYEKCKKEQNINELKDYIKKQKIMICSQCGMGKVKPDITFFGESLPKEFFDNAKLINQSDLLIVSGTSLQVQPFASLVEFVDCPIVMINRENSLKQNQNTLFLKGNIDEIVSQIVKDCQYKHPYFENNL